MGHARRLGAATSVQVSLDGRRLEGALAPTSEYSHLAALQARRDVVWSMHLHRRWQRCYLCSTSIRTITTDHAFYCAISRRSLPASGIAQLANAAAAGLAAGADVVLLRHHGCVVVGDTPDLVLSRAVNLEAAAEATYRARLLGDHSAECPPQFLEHVLGEEARGRRYGLRQ
jgi:L-fuculose-phosphate aldolase